MRILLVDDHTLVRQSLAHVLKSEPDIEIVGEAWDGKLAVEMTRALLPDIVLMDINMPVMNGIEATQRICAELPQVQVIGLSMYEHGEQAQPMLEAGAVAYVSKTDSPECLLETIRACYRRASGSAAP
jgi:DNA-binding NarL/FixJ family response regulator